jgi:hypothetical protein
VFGQVRGGGIDDRTGEEHPGLGGVDADVVEDGIELGGDELRRDLVHSADPNRVLGRQRDDRGHTVGPVARERLQIGLDAGAAARIRAGNRETTWNGQLHSLRRYEPDQVRRV